MHSVELKTEENRIKNGLRRCAEMFPRGRAFVEIFDR